MGDTLLEVRKLNKTFGTVVTAKDLGFFSAPRGLDVHHRTQRRRQIYLDQPPYRVGTAGFRGDLVSGAKYHP